MRCGSSSLEPDPREIGVRGRTGGLEQKSRVRTVRFLRLGTGAIPVFRYLGCNTI